MARTESKSRKTPRVWPAAEVVMRPIGELKPYARNPRKHSPEQIAQIAASITEFGFTVPLLIDECGELIAGHGRLLAAERLGIERVPCMVATGWTSEQRRAYVIADNQLAQNSTWDMELLRVELRELDVLGADLGLLGFDANTLGELLAPAKVAVDLEDADTIPDAEKIPITRAGDVWALDGHKILCGDSTNPKHLRALFNGELVDLIHADPPYGMGKEAEGVANDNLYREKLDAFQTRWLTTALMNARANCGLYVWGNAPDLWRWWYSGHDVTAEFIFRNEIVWAKGSGFGMNSDEMHGYSPETERCLFAMRGPQFLGNQNKDDYWQGYEPLRVWLLAERDAAKWTNNDVNRITKTTMAGHWFSKSQFQVIGEEHYNALRAAALGEAFLPTFEQLTEKFAPEREGGAAHRESLSEQMRSTRSYFDNTHDVMTDVWQFPRVIGAERFGHATPKPVAMIARALVSSCPKTGLVFEPFLGTGSTLIAAELFDRRCYGVELEPLYVDIAVRRWQEKTGRAATLAGTGDTFSDVAASRT